MYGFYINTIPDTQANSSVLFAQNIQQNSFEFRYVYFDKFQKDKEYSETDSFVLGIDGVLLNLKNLLNSYAKADLQDLLIYLYKKRGIGFVKELKGVFSGFIYEKKRKRLHVFNDKTATKQVFYTQVGDQILVAPNLMSLVQTRRELGESSFLDKKAVYTMLSFGGMMDNSTLVQGIYKLGAGEYLLFQDGKYLVDKYYDYNKIPINILSKSEAINRFDEVFVEAVKLEYEKDEEYGYPQLATLSGGLDSRMNVLVAKELGYNPDTFCFSQSKYADDRIAGKIASDLSLKHWFVPLDGGDYLKNLSKMVAINSGLHFYYGSAHYDYALDVLEKKYYGLMHTGQIGDGILGGLVTKEKTFLSKANTRKFLHKLDITEAYLKSFRDEEVFKIYQRVFNLTNFGSFVVEAHRSYLVSPFFDEDVMQVSLSMSPDIKINQDIYIDWIRKFHPKATNYIWERTGFKPNQKWKTGFSRYTNKLKKEFYTITKQQHKFSMNPIDSWLGTNPSILDFLNNKYQDLIVLIAEDDELSADLKEMFHTGSFMDKAVVLTILEAIKQNNLKV